MKTALFLADLDDFYPFIQIGLNVLDARNGNGIIAVAFGKPKLFPSCLGDISVGDNGLRITLKNSFSHRVHKRRLFEMLYLLFQFLIHFDSPFFSCL